MYSRPRKRSLDLEPWLQQILQCCDAISKWMVAEIPASTYHTPKPITMHNAILVRIPIWSCRITTTGMMAQMISVITSIAGEFSKLQPWCGTCETHQIRCNQLILSSESSSSYPWLHCSKEPLAAGLFSIREYSSWNRRLLFLQCKKKTRARARWVNATNANRNHKNWVILLLALSTIRIRHKQTETLTRPMPMTFIASEIALNSNIETTESGARQLTCLPMPDVIITVKKAPATSPTIYHCQVRRLCGVTRIV